jgi:hypothetical protein
MVRVGPKLSFVFDSFIMAPGRAETVTLTYTQYIFNPTTGMYDPLLVTDTFIERKPGFALFIPSLRWHQSEKKAFQFGFTGVVYDGEMWQIPIPMVQWYRTL